MKNQAQASKITRQNKRSGHGPVTCLQLTWRKPSVYAGVSDLGLQKKLNALECFISSFNGQESDGLLTIAEMGSLWYYMAMREEG